MAPPMFLLNFIPWHLHFLVLRRQTQEGLENAEAGSKLRRQRTVYPDVSGITNYFLEICLKYMTLRDSGGFPWNSLKYCRSKKRECCGRRVELGSQIMKLHA